MSRGALATVEFFGASAPLIDLTAELRPLKIEVVDAWW